MGVIIGVLPDKHSTTIEVIDEATPRVAGGRLGTDKAVHNRGRRYAVSGPTCIRLSPPLATAS